MTMPDGSGTRHAPLVWNVEEEDAAQMIEGVASGQIPTGMLFWVPLMAGAGDSSIANRWKAVATTAMPDLRQRGDLASVVMVFAELAGRVPEWQRGLEGFEMTESMIVNGWIRQGEIVQARRKLLRLVDRKFAGLVPQEVARVLGEQESLDVLDLWFDAAIVAKTVEEFTAVLCR